MLLGEADLLDCRPPHLFSAASTARSSTHDVVRCPIEVSYIGSEELYQETQMKHHSRKADILFVYIFDCTAIVIKAIVI